MKKIIAIVMALVMMMAVTVPAFAAITETSNQSGDSLVKTDTSAVGAGTYTVEIPAEIVIPWDAPTYDATYKVETQLAVGKELKVTVADKESGTLNGKMTATGTADVLEYTISGDVETEYVEVSNETETITFTVADWEKTIAEYSNYITFTVALSDKA